MASKTAKQFLFAFTIRLHVVHFMTVALFIIENIYKNNNNNNEEKNNKSTGNKTNRNQIKQLNCNH